MTSGNAPEERSWQPTLPGLTLPTTGPTPLEDAAVAALSAMDDDGLLEPRHALTVQLVLELSRVIGAGVRTGKTAAVALAAKQLLEALDSLPKPVEEPPADDAFTKLLGELEQAGR